jgi:hypothetical protein
VCVCVCVCVCVYLLSFTPLALPNASTRIGLAALSRPPLGGGLSAEPGAGNPCQNQ